MAPSPIRTIIDSLISPIAAIESAGFGISSGVSSAPATRPAPRDRLPGMANDGRTSVNRFVPGRITPPSPKPSSTPVASSSSKSKDLAFFMAEAKKKGKTGKGVSNYAYTMLKDSKMRSGTGGYTGARISGTKPK